MLTVNHLVAGSGRREGGGRFRNVNVSQDPSASPLFTIITATFNAADGIYETAESIRSQTYKDFEWILIDGGSNDGTVEFLETNEDVIDYWVSEKDEGIYDAFNKGCRKAKGNWIIFLGASDRLFDSHVLSALASAVAHVCDTVEIVYGKVAILGDHDKIVGIENTRWDQAIGKSTGRHPIMPHHQGVLQRRRLLSSDEPFDKRYSINADIKVVLGSFMRISPLFVDIVISRASLGGVSSEPQLALKAAFQTIRINREIGCFYDRLPEQTWLLCKSAAKTCMAMLFPDIVLKLLIDKYRVLTGRYSKWRS